MRRVYIIGDNNTVTSDASGIVLINCDGEAVTSDDNNSTIFHNRAFVIGSNGIATGTISVTQKTSNASFIAGNDAYNVYFIDASSGNIDVTLEVGSLPIWFVRTDGTANTVTITPEGGALINGAASYGLNVQYEKIHVLCDGTDFYF